MFNPDRIRLMTQAALFEDKEGREAFKVNGYFLTDYVTYHMVKGGISATFAYLILGGLWIFSQMEEFLGNLHTMDLPGFGKIVVDTYLKYMIAVEILILLVYVVKYFMVRKEVSGYSEQLDQIGQLYASEGRTRKSVQQQENVYDNAYEEAFDQAYKSDYENDRMSGGEE